MRRSSDRSPHGPGMFVMIVVALLAQPAGATGQARCDEAAGTLGIRALRCEGCTFRMSDAGIEEARFRTEPEVTAVARGFTTGDPLRPGDRIVAIDGALITTRDGSGRLVGLEAGRAVEVRVRREGKVVDLRMVAGSACALTERASRDEIEVEALPGPRGRPPRPAPPASGAVPGPPAPGGVLPPLPALPAAPAAPSAGPAGYLGFGFRCSGCSIHIEPDVGAAGDTVREVRVSFPEALEVLGVAGDGPAARAGIRAGDAIVAVDGADITTEAGGRRFAAIQPGDTVRLTTRRAGATRVVTVVASARPRSAPPALPAPAPLPAPAFADRLQYDGRVDGARVEVRGAPVRVVRDEADGSVTIHTGSNVIRVTGG
jgi:membrane-associated protease RseP (regulator of RpoE activity)